jgi:hypothetical protein
MKTAGDTVEADQKSYEMPPREGISIAHFSLSATSSGRLATTKKFSALAFSALVTATRPGTFSLRTSG